ncbi:DNA polymerase family B-domain-containing protein [Rhizophagus clarus]|uniref:DNA polymerase delta catalytic subunit n=1 Tax=Rhizophagus clarus TaxID=94130 RepID=A0A8H3LF07_9GLOM|nr:DNA polymerase family B-domain-containing protein [Rhizophagus clarus]
MHTPTIFDRVASVPSRNDIVAEYDNRMIAILQQCLSNRQPIHFMPTAVSDEAEYINGVSTYILRVSGCLINGQKAVVNVMDIKPFFDVIVPEEIPLSMFKTKLVKILSNILGSTSKFGIETISAFPLQGYHTEKKLYIRVRTWNHWDRHKALKAVREAGINTASDDLNPTYYYRKVARKERLPLSSWATLSNYFYEYIQGSTYFFQVSDIETYSSRKTGEVPNAKYDEDKVFMIGMTVHWKDDPEPLKQICLVNVETAPEPGWITIVCGSQTDLLKAFALCWKLLTPDIHIGFNDSQYDWRFIVEKAKKLGVLEWMFNQMSLKPSSLKNISKWQYQYNMIKVNDGNFYSKYLKIPGCVAIDVWPCFMRLYSKSEKSSLAYYLRECNLDNKVDLPIHRMNKYYKMVLKETNATTAEQMREVAKYCIIDALSCQQLMVKHNVINEYREVVSVSFLSLYDAHYFAGGMKVCNLLGASAWQRGILTSMISRQQTETRKYPGAYVFPPVKGLKNKRPVTGLDFASLYPSLIMTYNLSPDKIILSRERAEQSGKKLHEISFKFNNQNDLAWSIQHNNIPKEKGLYANVLEYLSSKRNEMKKCLAPLKEKKEDMELIIASMGKGLSLPETIEKEHEFMAEYDSICFDCSCLDAKQYALKVYMNTFYGTAGDSKSPFYLRALAGGVTSAGQRNIKLVTDFVKSKGFQIKYEDTDSLYLVPPERCFQECDEMYDSGNGIPKEEYWSRMVNISMEVMEKLRDEVNDFLRNDNGSSYLKMTYEEVLFPIVFTGKKKYYGIPYERKRIMDESMRVNNTRTLHQIVKDMLKETVKDISQTDLNEIIKTAVHTREEADAKRRIKKGLTPELYLYGIPESYERFEYVVVENDSSDKVGDKMEYPEVPSSEIVLDALKKLKNGNKAGDNKADDSGVDVDDLDKDEKDEDEIDKDEISKIRDALAQKSAEKWVRGYIKELHTGPKKDETIISHLWKGAHIYVKKLFDTTYADKGECLTNNAYYKSFLNALDKQEESIRLKLSSLLKEISEIDIEYRDSMYKLVTKKRAMTLEQYLTSYYLDECIKPNEICLPITKEDRQVFRKIIADQEKMTDIVMDDYRFLQHHGHNGKGGDRIHIGWLLGCTVADAEKILINPPKDLAETILSHIEKRFEEVPLAPVLIR